jgi:hypothetical protein
MGGYLHPVKGKPSHVNQRLVRQGRDKELRRSRTGSSAHLFNVIKNVGNNATTRVPNSCLGTAQQPKLLLIFIKKIVLATFSKGVARYAYELSEKRVGVFRS